METLIVDAYNIINFWDKTSKLIDSDLDYARDILNHTLQNYASYKGIEILVIYDAYKTDSIKSKEEKYENIKIVYTKKGQTADSYIEELIFDMKNQENISVVSSDWALQQMVLSGGLLRIPASELIYDISRIEKQISNKYDSKKSNDNLVYANDAFKDKLKDLNK
ncbi:MAG: NYN domain-containing protein [Eubacteriaceae bacterium]|nr:NYN domain-containing protein [Eubacteriaceae bacterium]